jgi:hypothetical protein
MVSRKALSIVHGVSATVHLTSAATIIYFLTQSTTITWPLIHRGWENDGEIYNYELAYLLPLFPALSAVNHIVSLADSTLYDSILANKVNYLRWAEYSVSAGVMIWAIASLSGILEIRSLVSLVMLNALLQYFGYLIEKAVARSAPREEIVQLILAAWGVHMTMWIPIFISFFTVVSDSDIPAPEAVWTIVVLLFILFSSFGILETLWALGVVQDFNGVEMGFAILSLTAKVFLTFMAYFGVLNKRETEEVNDGLTN